MRAEAMFARLRECGHADVAALEEHFRKGGTFTVHLWSDDDWITLRDGTSVSFSRAFRVWSRETEGGTTCTRYQGIYSEYYRIFPETP